MSQDADGLQAELARQRRLVDTLAARLQGRVIETHLSWVLLLPDVAYKIKKALRLEFVDYASLEARLFYCKEELRLNRRLAPGIYQGVARITGDDVQPAIDGDGPVLEYAVKMRAFDQEALWDNRLHHGVLSETEIDLLARLLAAFHSKAARAPATSPLGCAGAVLARTAQDLAAIDTLLSDDAERAMFANLLAWHRVQEDRLAPLFDRRKQDAWVRECHGDLHCGNILTIDGNVSVFDCIEFNDGMRWIDVLHDLAFACMDLDVRGRPELAARLLNGYMQAGGDYAGMAVFGYYRTQRALVRCKVALLRATQPGADARGALAEARAYLAYAACSIGPGSPALIITHGLAGSGKSTISFALADALGALQLRSDIERKRMSGVEPGASAAARPAAGLYAAHVTRDVYRQLAAIARQVVEAGLPVIVDAAFLRKRQRRLFRALARRLGVPFLILDVRCHTAALQERVAERARTARDPSDADLHVLAYQMATREPLSDSELAHALAIDHEHAFDSQERALLAESVRRALRKR